MTAERKTLAERVANLPPHWREKLTDEDRAFIENAPPGWFEDPALAASLERAEADNKQFGDDLDAEEVQFVEEGHPDLVDAEFWVKVRARIDAMKALPPEDFSVEIPEF